MIVADTNLIVYLLLPGEHTEAAEALLARDPDWRAPRLWRSEFRNVVAHYLRRGALNLAGALELVEEAEELMAGREYEVGSAAVLERVAASSCTAYDCEFVALAEELGAALVTSDAAVLAAFPGTAISPEKFVSKATD